MESEKGNGVSDIVERLRYEHKSFTESELVQIQAADEIESLRQRVKELERVNAIHAEANSIIRRDNDTLKAELAALKAGQGEPIIWIAQGHLREVSNGNTMNCYCAPEKDRFAEVALYTAPTIPEGWVMVPVEPTDTMIDALALAKNSTMQGYKSLLTDTEFRDMAKAMLSAAPKPEETK